MTDREFDRMAGVLEYDEGRDYEREFWGEYWDRYDYEEERGKERRKYGKEGD